MHRLKPHVSDIVGAAVADLPAREAEMLPVLKQLCFSVDLFCLCCLCLDLLFALQMICKPFDPCRICHVTVGNQLSVLLPLLHCMPIPSLLSMQPIPVLSLSFPISNVTIHGLHGAQDARGDQCDSCGNLLNPTDLINPKCKLTGTTPVLRTTKHIFLDLPKLSPQLQAYITEASNKGGWSSNCVQVTPCGVHESGSQ